jgi:hypothetical protein
MILTSSGERGGWDAAAEDRISALINTIDLVYPSGKVHFKVLDHGAPVALQWVGVQLPTVIGLVSIARVKTDAKGEADLVLGESAKFPYRVFVNEPGDSDWQWLEVHSNHNYDVILRLENKHPFYPSMTPPPLAHTPSGTK